MTKRIRITAAYAAEWLREGSVRNEDGDRAVIVDYHVVAQTADGSRYQHVVAFTGRCGVTEEGFGYGIDGDKVGAQKLAARVDAAGWINLEHWDRAGSCYGSEAYVRDGGEQELIEWERSQR